MRIVVLGPPGSGKGMQAEKVSDKYGVPHIATGDMLRDAVAEGTELGEKAKGYMDRGELVPDELVVAITGERLRRQDCHKGFLLDGFPRTKAQAEALERILASMSTRLDVVINLNVDEEEIVKRLTKRRTCRRCGAIYHLIFSPPKRDGVCDDCGGELYRRSDDSEETVRKRLRVYKAKTESLVDYYIERGLLRDIDGNPSVEEVFRNICEALKGKR